MAFHWDWKHHTATAERAGPHGNVPTWPPDFFESLTDLRHGDPRGVEMFIDFLESDPIAFRTGYTAEKVLRWLKRVALTKRQQERLRFVLLDAVERRHRQYFRRFCALARALDTPALRTDLLARLKHPTEPVRRHARWMLDALGEVVDERADAGS